MDIDDPVQMDADEVTTFLGNGGTGVLSLSTAEADPPHAMPVSYGYDDTERTLYFRLAVGPESSKAHLAERAVTFVTYDQINDRWQSVIAAGGLEAVEKPGIEIETLEGLDHVQIPLVDMFTQPTRVVEFEFYRLVPEELTGRIETPKGD